jgi:CHASE1-domain containing sensor protein
MDPVVVVPAAIVTGGVVLSTLAVATVVVVLAFLARAPMEQLIQHHLAQAYQAVVALAGPLVVLLIIL